MTDETNPAPDFNPKSVPERQDLPQGANEFLEALGQAFEAVNELFMPYISRHPGLYENFKQVRIKLSEAGFWVNDSMNALLNPEILKAGMVQEESEDAPQA